ncbi:MAG: glycoside hydrolase family 28 protein [Paludibacter sp.]
MKQISAPTFKNVDYQITKSVAIDNNTADYRKSINEAISICSFNGGGRVVIPAGKYHVNGSIILKSNVNLYLAEGSEIIFSSKPEAYLPAVLTTFEGTELFNYSPLVYAYQVSNIAITGKGILNGNATTTFAKMRAQGSNQQNQLRQMGIDGVPVFQRTFGNASILPPNMVQFFGCKNILIEGIRIIDAPYWVIHPAFCNNVTVRAVEVNSHNLNNDGCDPESTTNVLIENCIFNTRDDAIAIKAGRDNDGWRIGQSSRNIIIRNCKFRSECNGLCIGSEMSAGVENVYMENVNVGNCLSAVYFKSNLDRGGFIKNVWVRNVTCDSVKTAFIRFETNYHGARGGFHPALFQNFLIENVTGNYSAECGFFAVGIAKYPLKDILLKNINLKQSQTPYILKNTENVTFDKVMMNGNFMPNKPKETEKSKLKTY